ncbi:MAG: hypothetical protein AAFX10_17435 [Pseudomonadota bacterium]
MCEHSSSKPKRGDDRYLIVDHADKLVDRSRPNPNRRLIARRKADWAPLAPSSDENDDGDDGLD